MKKMLNIIRIIYELPATIILFPIYFPIMIKLMLQSNLKNPSLDECKEELETNKFMKFIFKYDGHPMSILAWIAIITIFNLVT